MRTQQFGDPNGDQIGDDNSNSSASRRRRLPDDDDDMDDDDDENDADSTNLPLNLVATQFAEWDYHMQTLIVVAVGCIWKKKNKRENKT